MNRLLILGSCAWLVGCGGCGNDAPPRAGIAPAAAPAQSAEGAYGGAQVGGIGASFQMLVLENNDIWSIYGDDTATGLQVSGFVQGAGASSNGQLNSHLTTDFGPSTAVAKTTIANYDVVAKTISGTFSAAGSTVNFNGGPVSGYQYNYNTAASLVNVAGSWAALDLLGEHHALTVSAAGSISATSSAGCTLLGTMAPRPSGKNVFDVALTFGTVPCASPGQMVSGIAISYPLNNGTTKLIIVATDVGHGVGRVLSAAR